MAQSESLRVEDVRAVIRIVNECRELGADAVEWRRHLAEELRLLMGARLVTVGEGGGVPTNRLQEVRELIPSGVDAEVQASFQAYKENNAALRDAVPLRMARAPAARVTVSPQRNGSNRDWYHSDVYHEYYRVARCCHAILSNHVLPAWDGQNTISVFRPPDGPPFGPRERLLVDLIHEGIGGMLGRALATSRDPGLAALSPRLRRTLDCLLDGDSEKQAALRIGIRPATVHEYVIALYRHFGVDSRAELLAHFLRRFRGNQGH